MRTRGNAVARILPAGVTGQIGLETSVLEEFKIVAAAFTRGLPPEVQSAGAGDGGLNPRLLVVADDAALRGIHGVVGVGGLRVPVGIAAGGPGQVGGVQGIRQTEGARSEARDVSG